MSSTVNVRRISTTRAAVIYEFYGSRGSEKFVKNLAEGTTRVAAMRTDAGSVDEFVERAEALAEKHGRKVESRSIIQSFPKSQMDPSDPARVQYVNDLGYEFAKRLHPNSDVLVITHIDGAGGHPHNHIKVINHDNVTGKALRGNHLHWQVVPVNDALMTEHGLGVVERNSQKQRAGYWEQVRDAEKLSEFDLKLGDDIEESLADPRSIDLPSYSKVLAEKGIELEEKAYAIQACADGAQSGHESVGWTYKAMDETGPKHRKRRRKASALSAEFTRDGAQELFDINKGRQPQNVSTGTDRAAGGATAVQLGAVRVHQLHVSGNGADAVAREAGSGVAEPSDGGNAGTGDLAAVRNRLAAARAAAARHASGNAGDLKDPRADERNAYEVGSGAPSGRKSSKSRGPRFTFDDDHSAERDEGRSFGD